MTVDTLCVANAQTLLDEEPHFSEGNLQSLHAGHAHCKTVFDLLNVLTPYKEFIMK